ncbi:hypothetical protein [Nostoc sp. MG11]|uniref:hypothetical protein n=1 Tax=Nostoc sp. MG11 TaxID=2721166 RepID=UPI001866CE53|nr:hypothetical protein [Nostoc sp. MG11]
MTDNIPERDPAWDYYITWHNCQYAKALIDKALSIVTSKEFPSAELYQKSQELIRDAEGILHQEFR